MKSACIKGKAFVKMRTSCIYPT